MISTISVISIILSYEPCNSSARSDKRRCKKHWLTSGFETTCWRVVSPAPPIQPVISCSPAGGFMLPSRWFHNRKKNDRKGGLPFDRSCFPTMKKPPVNRWFSLKPLVNRWFSLETTCQPVVSLKTTCQQVVFRIWAMGLRVDDLRIRTTLLR